MEPDFDIHSVISKLARSRPVFHSEADFQFAFAWEIQLMHPSSSVRLEYNPQVFDSRTYIDIWVRLGNGENIAIELKYKTKKTKLTYDGENYELARHGAPANNRFLIVQDIERVEYLVGHIPNTTGYAVALTNDNEYWQTWKRPKDTKDRAFRIHEGADLTGVLHWKEDTAKSTIKSLGESLCLERKYTMKWLDYSTTTDSTFKFLINKVAPIQKLSRK